MISDLYALLFVHKIFRPSAFIQGKHYVSISSVLCYLKFRQFYVLHLFSIIFLGCVTFVITKKKLLFNLTLIRNIIISTYWWSFDLILRKVVIKIRTFYDLSQPRPILINNNFSSANVFINAIIVRGDHLNSCKSYQILPGNYYEICRLRMWGGEDDYWRRAQAGALHSPGKLDEIALTWFLPVVHLLSEI